MFGKLTLQAFTHPDPISTGGALSMVAAGISVIVLITYFKRWKWLWKEWLTTVDPKRIGVMYLIVSGVMLMRGVADALLLRAQQSTSVGASQGILSSNHFQQIFTAHGSMMIFFVAMGLMFGLINLIVPMQIGARDVAFPFLNAMSFWLFCAGAGLMNLSLIVGEIAATGWLAYPPLSELRYSPGVGVDYWILSLQISGVGSMLSGINFFTTILKMRAAGMRLMKMPLFTWSVLNSMVLVMFAFPILTVTLTLLFLDRYLGMHFFTSYFGGNPMLYVNLIWAWGHPEVYILVLPAFGIYSEIVSTFSEKKLFGYTSMVVALAIITVLSFLVWLHHFFTMGAGADVNAFFGIMTMIISIPTGVKVFNWLFTMYRGRIHFTTPMLWFFGFLATFTLGGVAGVMLAVPAADYELHNSLFLVAHFHTMIIGGVVFGYFAAITYWFPKIAGFKLNERLGKYAFWCWVVGFMLSFIPLYILGILGATRRMDHYDASLGWQQLFIVSAVGVVIIGLGIAFQLLQIVVSVIQRKDNKVTDGDPWNGRTLEWATATPVPEYNFARLPIVSERDALWAAKQQGKPIKMAPYEDIEMPKNTPLPIIIAGWSFAAGFALVWHIDWLAIVTVLGLIVTVIVRLLDEHTEYTIPAATVRKLEQERARSAV